MKFPKLYIKLKLYSLFLLLVFAFALSSCAKPEGKDPPLLISAGDSVVENPHAQIKDELESLQDLVSDSASDCDFELLDYFNNKVILQQNGVAFINLVRNDGVTIVEKGKQLLNNYKIHRIEIEDRGILGDDLIEASISIVAKHNISGIEYKTEKPHVFRIKRFSDGTLYSCSIDESSYCGNGKVEEFEVCDASAEDKLASSTFLNKAAPDFSQNYAICSKDCKNLVFRYHAYKNSYDESNEYFSVNGGQYYQDVSCKRNTKIKQYTGNFEGRELSTCEEGSPLFRSGGVGSESGNIACSRYDGNNHSYYGIVCGK
jgi:hypothetical protein